MPREGAVILSDLVAPTLTLVCGPCERRGRYSVAKLIEKHGDARLTDLRHFLSANCPRQKTFQGTDGCQALFDPPPEIRQTRPKWVGSNR